MSKTGVISIGVKAPIIRQGDDLKQIVINSVNDVLNENGIPIKNGDIIAITESVVARSQGNYVTVDDIVQYLTEMNIAKHLILYSPIMSRNRFSMILKGFARFANEITIVLDGDYDTQGDPNYGINPFTGVDIQEYYKELCANENCKLSFVNNSVVDVVHGAKRYNLVNNYWTGVNFGEVFIDSRCHPQEANNLTLKDIMKRPVQRNDGTMSGYNSKYGLLGSNKATEEKLKLFPESETAQQLVDEIQEYYRKNHNVNVEVLVYGDGCFKSPEENGVSIWEFADPVTCPAYTSGLNGTPNEIKIKAFADDQFNDLSGEELEMAVKNEIEKNRGNNLVGSMNAQGTTPRRYTDLLASLCDLTTGSGDKGCPIALVKNYFLKYND